MNMKKTIAAVAAGAMAVSAMATSVSALENKTMTYNLVAHGMNANKGSVTVEGSTVTDALESVDDISVGMYIPGDYKVKEVEITATKIDEKTGASQGTPITFKGQDDKTKDYYDANVAAGGFMTIPVGTAGKALETRCAYKFRVVAKVEHSNTTLSGANDGIKGKAKVGFATPAVKNTAYKDGDDGYGNDKLTKEDLNAAFSGSNTEVSTYGFTASGAVYRAYEKPFKTSTTNNVNIIGYLEDTTGLKAYEWLLQDPTNTPTGNGLNYNNVRAVINDAIANYETVEFTFNTAAKGIKWTVDDVAQVWCTLGSPEAALNHFNNLDGSAVHEWGNHGYKKSDGSAVTTDDIIGIYSDAADADTSYTSFANQLYNGWANTNATSFGNPSWGGYYNGEGGTFYGYDFMQTNLFGAALIVNEGVTMSLADTDFFDYGTTSITFDWDAIYANGNTTPNAFATYVQTLKLMTSVDWYWDSMSVTVTLGEAEDAAAGAGAEGDEAELGDDEGSDEDISLDETEDKAPAEDEEPAEDEAPADETPAPVQNPGTGNAPIALAVIPVALAAAAVVAKKRG